MPRTRKEPYKRPPRIGEGRPAIPDEQKRTTKMVRVSPLWYDYIAEQAERRGETMGQFVEHVMKLHRDTPQVL